MLYRAGEGKEFSRPSWRDALVLGRRLREDGSMALGVASVTEASALVDLASPAIVDVLE